MVAGAETRTGAIRGVLAGILVANILVVLTKAVVSNGPSSRRSAYWSSWCSFRC